MKKIRIKNDIRVSWGITTNNQQVSLENRKLAVSLIVYNLIIPIKDFTVSGNVITFVFHGNDQYRCGVYTLVCQDSTNGEVNTIDKTDAFMLVPHSSEESGEDNENVALEVVQLSTDRSSTTIGKAATVRVGEVKSLSPDDFATVSNDGTVNDAVLKFGIPRGKDGLSAYDVARLHGFEGTQQEWLDSLKPSLERILHQINTSDVNNLIPRRGGYLYFDGASWKWEDKPRFYALENNGSSGIGKADYDYILKQIEDRFLSRIVDDSAKGIITFEEMQKFLRGFRIGNYTDQSGGQWELDSEGRSSITTDYLQVRMKAIFETLEILHTDTVGGRLVISPVGSNRILKVEEVTTTYNSIEQKAYRCYFLAEQDGAEVQNKWKVGDQARAESFNVGKGIYHHVGNHFLWRLVIGINGEIVEIDGKKYNYVDLSQIDSAPGSDAPAPDDVLNQLGNRNDATRQSALVFSAVDNFSPSVTIYQGINTFSWYGKEYVEYGVNNGKAFFNLYGDTYIGDKDTVNPKSYLKYNSTTKKFEIKADIDIKSTFDGKELPDYIKDNTLSKDEVDTIVNGVREDLQGQIDGAIETWFYEGVPTLGNEPAVNWKDDETKNVHLGDLYYDKKTGMAYRFMLDNKEYKWVLIKDLDITKALADAAKAQLTADGKMTVFSEQPNPPYQEGDIWVNATYKDTDGNYIYKDDLLRCKIGKEEGDGFDINDWQLAAKYTDDTALDDFKQEYTEVMASYKKQLDGKVETWYYDYPPTTTNEPAKNWNEDEKSDHAGDLFYNTKTGYAYRWTGALWARIKDSDITEALDAASKAQDTADHKRTNFTSKPTPPYDLGDLWTDTSDDGKILKVCVNAKKEGEKYSDSDWVESNDATLNAFSKTVNESLEGIQDQLDQKAETWYQAVDPSLAWKTSEEKTLHKGDLWYDTNTGKTYYYTGSKWEQQNIPSEVFDRIDGKAEIFAGEDGPKSYHENDLWILPVKKTVNGTEYAKGEVLTAIATNLERFNEKDWTKLVSYTDDTKANNVEKAFNQFKTNEFNTLNKNYKDFCEDGVFDIAEIKALKSNITDVNNSFSRLKSVYDELIKSDFLKETVDNVTDYVVDAKKLIGLFETFETAKDSYITTINNAIADGKATSYDKEAYESSYNSFTEAYDNFVNQLAKVEQLAIKNLYNEIGNDYGYLKEAYKKDTKVQGGLVLTSTIQLRDGKGSNEKVTGGINGILENGSLSSIAAWYGGPMADKDHYPGTDTPTPGTNCARSLFRHDGSGYLSSGAIHWDTEGNLHVNPLSFVLKGQDVGVYLVLFKLHLMSGVETATSLDHIDWITPQKPFSELSVLSNIVVGDGKQDSSIIIGNVKITNKAGTNELAFTNVDTNDVVNIWTSGGLSAYGNGSTGSGGGGLNANIKSYIEALKLTEDSNDYVASAYSIAALSKRIDGISGELSGLNLDWSNITGKPETFTPSAHTHSVKINGSTKTIAATGGTAVDLGTYLVSSDLASYVNSIETTDTGNAITSVTKDGKKLTFTKGSTFSLSTHNHDSAYLGKTAKAADSDKLDGWHLKDFYDFTTIRDFADGTLVKTSIDFVSSRAFLLEVKGNGYEGGLVNFMLQGYIYGTTINVLNPKCICLVPGCIDSIRISAIDGKLCFWWKRMAYWQGFNITCKYVQGNNKNTVVSVTNSTQPTGTFNLDVKPVNTINSSNIGSQSVASAAKLATARTINGTSFNGTANITTANWGTARSIGIVSSDGTSTAVTVSVNGGANVNLKLPSTIKASLSGNASTATKLATARTLWGNSFDGSASISGKLTLKDGNHGALMLGTAYLSCLSGNIIMQNTKALRFSTSDSWDYNVWAGLKYDHSAKTIYLGLADNTIFTANSAQSGGTLSLPGIQKITLGGVTMEYDSTNKALKVNGSLYATGGITAYGEGSASGSGGLNGQVLEYSKAVSETSESTTKIASAYSIAKLKSLIDGIDGSALTEVDWGIIKNKPSTFTPSSHSHTFASLTSKPTSLSGFGITDGVNTVATSGSGNAVTSVSISGHTLTQKKDSKFLESVAWWNSGDAHNANDLSCGITFANSSHSNTGTTGTLVDFTCKTNNNYPFQLQSSYTADNLYYRRRNGDNGTWGSWKRLARAEEIPTSYAGSASVGGDATRALKLMDYNGSKNIYCGFDGAGLSSSNIGYIAGISYTSGSNDVYYKDVNKGELQKWLGLGSRAYDNTSYLPLTGGTLTGNISAHAGIFCGRVYGTGDDEGVLIKPASNGYAGLILGATDSSLHTVLYLNKNTGQTFWRYVNGSKNVNIYHPGKEGYIALTSDIPTRLSEITNDMGYITSSASITGNAATSTLATYVKDSTNGNKISITYAKAGQSSTSWLASWNGYELGSISPSALKLSSFADDILSGHYLSLAGGTLNANARISHPSGGLFYLGNADNSGWVVTQDIASQTNVNNWSIRTSGAAQFGDIYICSKSDHTYDTGIIERVYSNGNLYLQYYQKGGVYLCYGGGQVTCGSNLLAKGGITAYSSSDLRLKTNLHKADSLSLIKSLGSVYEFDYKKTREHSYGLIAQNVQKSRLGDLVANDDDGYLKLNYWSPKLISLALGGIVQVDDKVTKLKRKVAKLERRIKELEVANTKLLECKKESDKDNISNND